MSNNFYDFVKNELQKALPPHWESVSPYKLPARGRCKITHAFHSDPVYEEPKLINILVLPLSIELDNDFEYKLIRLKDHILSKGCVLVVISEETHTGSLSDTSAFIQDSLFTMAPGFLWIICSREHNYKTCVEVESEIFEDLHMVLRDLWKGLLRYDGPTPGLQQVNLELMEDKCRECHGPMKTVTGIVFPTEQLERWDNPDWSYYDQLLSLSELTGKNARSIQQFVNLLRKVDPLITPIKKQYDDFEETTVASCPHCKALCDNFDVIDTRDGYLLSLENRITGQLKYYSISLKIDQDLIDCLLNGGEISPHSYFSGWTRE